jgi:hypothetical protein
VRLVNAHVSYYRSIEDSEEFEIDPDVTCMVGKNEAGKTAVLQALYRLNPVGKVGPFDEDLDFPTRKSAQRRKYLADQGIPVVVATFELTSDEVDAVAAELGERVLKSRTFTLTRGYRIGAAGQWGVSYDEATIVEHLVAQLDATAREESESFWGRRAPGCLVGVDPNKTSGSYPACMSGARMRLGYQR